MYFHLWQFIIQHTISESIISCKNKIIFSMHLIFIVPNFSLSWFQNLNFKIKIRYNFLKRKENNSVWLQPVIKENIWRNMNPFFFQSENSFINIKFRDIIGEKEIVLSNLEKNLFSMRRIKKRLKQNPICNYTNISVRT